MKWLKQIAEWWGKLMCVIALHKDVWFKTPNRWEVTSDSAHPLDRLLVLHANVAFEQISCRCIRCGKLLAQSVLLVDSLDKVFAPADVLRMKQSPHIKNVRPICPVPAPSDDREGVLVELQEFAFWCKDGSVCSDDGSGRFATATHFDRESAVDCRQCGNDAPEWATHVVWFNK